MGALREAEEIKERWDDFMLWLNGIGTKLEKLQRGEKMGYTVEAILKVRARVNVSADDPREAEIEASATNSLDWELIDTNDCEIVEVLHSEPNGSDYDPLDFI